MAIAFQLVRVQAFQRDQWLNVGQDVSKSEKKVGKRGNIYDANQNLLVTTQSIYSIAFDPLAPSQENFDQYAPLLAERLAEKYKTKSAKSYLNLFEKYRRDSIRCFPISKVSLEEYKELAKWPMFSLGRNTGGFVADRVDERQRPFGALAGRTLGIDRSNIENGNSVGLEQKYHEFLLGEERLITKERLVGNTWVGSPYSEELPLDGQDLFTTLDIRIQDIAHTALKSSLETYNADHGCAIVMEVKTGKIKAIVNLGKDKKDQFYEDYNHAIAERTNPGSTVKAAMLLAMIADKKVSLNTLVDLENGKKKYYDKWMRDDHPPKENEVTVQRAFEISSNVGISKLINESYKNDPWQLIDRLKSFGLSAKTEIDITGEPLPNIPYPNDGKWSGISLPWMAIGYELELTPLQLLTFYNAIANDGLRVNPYLVEKTARYAQVIQEFNKKEAQRICAEKDAIKIQKALRSVVLRGTARNISSDYLTIAGKTGTAILDGKKSNQKTDYQASFVGFFPAEEPHYSCIVVVNSLPNTGGYYGGEVAAPVFQEIAEKVFAKDIKLQEVYQEDTLEELAQIALPPTKSGVETDIVKLYEMLEIPHKKSTQASLVYPSLEGAIVNLKEYQLMENGKVPNVMNMGLRDALFILENEGLKVRFKGAGKVIKQSLKAGATFDRGTEIEIELS